MCCLYWTQACSPIIGYIPGPIGSLFAIAPKHFLEWQIFESTAHLKRQPESVFFWHFSHSFWHFYGHDENVSLTSTFDQ